MSHRDEIRAYQERGDDAFRPGSGGCLRQALKSLGVNAQVDEFVPFDELRHYVESLGLSHYGVGQSVTLPGSMLVCVVYETDDERMLHAQTMTMRHAKTEGLLEREKLRAIITR